VELQERRTGEKKEEERDEREEQPEEQLKEASPTPTNQQS
jgi:hypothetical protein